MTFTGTRADAAEPETVLVVDHEVLVRMVIAGYLRDCGYRVIEAAGADEARAVVASDEARVSVVLASLEAAGAGAGDGFALARWIRERRPGVEVILAGTPARAAEAAGDICEQGPLLARPYDRQVVHDRIRRLLARRPPR
jgi:DNA-binding NtrC family response regulator